MDKEWNAIPGISLVVGSDNTFLGGGLSPGTSATVLRMLGEYVIAPRTSPVAIDEAQVVIGIGVISGDAFAAGAASVPDPGGEPEYPWLYWASHSLFFGSTQVDPASDAASLRAKFDIRSMRKMKPRETLAFIVQYININGNPDLKLLIGATRVLLGGV